MEVLTEKYRPRKFEDIIGQQHIVLDVQRLLQNKTPSVVILSGPPGCGKTTTARIIAAQMNCTDSENAPCGVCKNCQDILHRVHPNVIEIDAASRGGVAEMRKYVDTLMYAPTHGGRVLVVDEAHCMSSAAASALLAPTEQLPEFSSIILATTDVNSLSAALRSRAVYHGMFVPVSEDDIVKRLKHIADTEGYTVQDDVLSLIVAKSNGQVRNAINTLGMCFSAIEDTNIELKSVRHLLINEHMLIYAMIICMIKGDLDAAMAYATRVKAVVPSSKDVLSTWLETERMIMAQALGGLKYFPESSIPITAEMSFERVQEIWSTVSTRSQLLTPDAMLHGLIMIFTKPKFLIKDTTPADDSDIQDAFK